MFLDRFHTHAHHRSVQLSHHPFPPLPPRDITHSLRVHICSVMSVIWRRGNQRRGVKMTTYIYINARAGLARPGVVGFYEQQPGHWCRKFLATPPHWPPPTLINACVAHIVFRIHFHPTHTHTHTQLYFRVCVGHGVLWEYIIIMYTYYYIRNICVTLERRTYTRGLRIVCFQNSTVFFFLKSYR